MTMVKYILDVHTEGAVVGQPYSNAGFICTIKHWLITLLAGEDCVMLNIALSCEEDKIDEFYAVCVDNVDGFLANNNSFDLDLLKKNHHFKIKKNET